MAISQDVIFEANRPTRELSIKKVDRFLESPKSEFVHIFKCKNLNQSKNPNLIQCKLELKCPIRSDS